MSSILIQRVSSYCKIQQNLVLYLNDIMCDNTITDWLANEDTRSKDGPLDIRAHLLRQWPTPLLSNLSSIFKETAVYSNLTRQEALNTIAYFLYEYDDIIHTQLLECFLTHQLLKSTTDSYLVIDKAKQISGIFTSLSRCYSPRCQVSNITCYSPLCPNKQISGLLRLVQQTNNEDSTNMRHKDWIEQIPPYLLNSITHVELKRQAAIGELLVKEKNYSEDLHILHTIYAIPLLSSDHIIHISRQQSFYNEVFGNYLDIMNSHDSFYQILASHRYSSYFMGRVGKVVLQHVTNLIEPYLEYASSHVRAIYRVTVENKNNAQFAKFLQDQNINKCTRRLGLRHYLTSPTLWLGKMKLLIEAILKNTIDDADQLALKASIAILHDTLNKMNSCTKKAEEELCREELISSIYIPSSLFAEEVNISIPPDSTLIKQEKVWLARSTHPLQPSICHIFLFSHSIVLTHPRINQGKKEHIVVTGTPIPIQMILTDSTNSTSLIRRLSFASSSIVSSPYHLISSFRNSKAKPENTSLSAPKDNSELVLSKQNSKQASIPIQIKNQILKLKNSMKWDPSLSLPVSSTIETKEKLITVTRRDSAPASLGSKPALLRSKRNHRSNTTIQRERIQNRTLKIGHMAYPEIAFQLEFFCRVDRERWEKLINDTISNKCQHNLFKIQVITKSLSQGVERSSSLLSTTSTTSTTSSGSTLVNSFSKPSSNVTSGLRERISCICSFDYYNPLKGNENYFAAGTQNGILIGLTDGSSQPQLVLALPFAQQISVLDDKLIVLSGTNKSELVAYGIHSLMHSFTSIENQTKDTTRFQDWCMIKRKSVICFAIGKVRNQSVIVYLTQDQEDIWLVVVVPTGHADQSDHWFKKYKVTYKVSIKNPNAIQLMYDAAFIQSNENGVERINITPFESSMKTEEGDHHCEFQQHVVDSKILVTVPNIGFVLLPHIFSTCVGVTSNSHCAWFCSLDHRYELPLTQHHIQFESQVNRIAVVYPYLVAFSLSVIEIRHLKTTELIQAIQGQRIQFISKNNNSTKPILFFTMANITDSRLTSVYKLQLSV
ncbi:hypothetical protein K501DRAFT_272036 [Backusella circina FSU 941]|nr:hypothetical protein K501DRAFT_272036 [Backusella circina FSU 941]